MSKFKSGADWKGNAKGRPPDFRVQMTKETVLKYYSDTHEILDILVKHAKEGNSWAVKLYVNTMLQYVLSKPRTEIDVDDGASAALVDIFKIMPKDKLKAIESMVMEEVRDD